MNQRRDNNKNDNPVVGNVNNKKRHEYDNRRKSDNLGYGNNNQQRKDDQPLVKPTLSVNDRIQNRNVESLKIEENPSEKLANMNFESLTSISPKADGHFDWSEEVERATLRLEAAAREEEARRLEAEKAAKEIERNFDDGNNYGKNQQHRSGNQNRRNRRLVCKLFIY